MPAVPDLRVAAVRGNQVLAVENTRLATLHIPRHDRDTVSILTHGHQLRALDHRCTCGQGAIPQDRLQARLIKVQAPGRTQASTPSLRFGMMSANLRPDKGPWRQSPLPGRSLQAERSRTVPLCPKSGTAPSCAYERTRRAAEVKSPAVARSPAFGFRVAPETRRRTSQPGHRRQ